MPVETVQDVLVEAATKNMRNPNRKARVTKGVRELSYEEANYWLAQMVRHGTSGVRALRSLVSG